MSEQVIKLDGEYFENTLNDKLSISLKNYINAKKLNAQLANKQEVEYCVKMAIESILSNMTEKSGSHRINKWENGWNENLQEFTRNNSKESLVPKYWGKNKYSRIKQEFVIGSGENIFEPYDNEVLGIIVRWLLEKYAGSSEISSIYEFGCGTGQHLIRAAEINPNADIYGLDWAVSSQKIIEQMNNNHIKGYNFDYFNPDSKFKIKKNGVVFTVTSLEQVGCNFEHFIEYLIENRPKLCFHVEPIAELLDENNLYDYLSIKYFEKRNYLNGLLSYLEKKEKNGEIEIIQKQRTLFGNMFVDGWSVIAWKCK